MIQEGKTSVRSQVGSGLAAAGRLCAAVAVWWFGIWTFATFVFATGPDRLLGIVWAVVTIASMLFALTGWPFKRTRFDLLLVGRMVAGLCVLWFGALTMQALAAFDRSQHLVAVPLGVLTTTALVFAITGWPFARQGNRQGLKDPTPSEGANL